MKHKRALVLNADYRAMSLISWQNAIEIEYKNSAQVLDFYKNDFIICADGGKWPVPAILVLKMYVKPIKKVSFTKGNVFLRDKLKCQYCTKSFLCKDLTYDHVIPRSKWDKSKGSCTSWENIVSCCYPCNHKKADLTLKEAGLKLLKEPKKPYARDYVPGIKPWTKLQPEWLPYLPKHYVELLEVDSR